MAAVAVNGAIVPQPDQAGSVSPTSKRKRSESAAHPLTNGSSPRDSINSGLSGKALEDLLRDILEILRSYDTKPSILDFQFSSQHRRTSSHEPSHKRTKLSNADGSCTIAQLVNEGAYTSLQELLEDVETASSEILAPLTEKENSSNGVAQPSMEETRLLTRALAFQKALRNIIRRECRRVQGSRERVAGSPVDGAQPVANGVVKEEPPEEEVDNNGTPVLTLYGAGGSNGPRQMFSSLQQPVHIRPEDIKSLDASVDVTLPVTESSLPSFLSVTKVAPVSSEEALGRKRVPTFGELFAPPVTIPQISPPKPAKQLTTRGSTVTWVPNEYIAKSSRQPPVTYPSYQLPAGLWLNYGGVDTARDGPTSPTAKQRSRQRALSTGEVNPKLSEAAVDAILKAKEDALFRSVYSSFAPTRDDSIAIIPTEIKNKVWWQRYGAQKFQEAMIIDPNLLDGEDNEVEEVRDEVDDEEIRIAVENYVEPEPFDEKTVVAKDIDNPMDEVLRDISEQIETLYSLQCIRNSTLSNGRAQNTAVAQMVGTPAEPASEEIDMYKMLRDMLALTISNLPPYAVAKLNGDKLAALNLNPNLIIETKDYRGVLEEDQVSRLAKQTALSAAAGTPSLPRTSSAHGHYPPASNQYGRTPSAGHIARAGYQSGQSYYPQQQPPHRSPSVHYQRGVAPPQTYHQPPPTAGAAYPSQTPRASYAATGPSYAQQPTPRPAYASQPTPGTYAPRAPQAAYSAYAPQYATAVGTPQAPRTTYAATPQQQQQQPPQYAPAYAQQPRPASVAPMYSSYPPQPAGAPAPSASAIPRTGSPVKQYAPQPRMQYPPSTPGGAAATPARPAGTYYATYPATPTPVPAAVATAAAAAAAVPAAAGGTNALGPSGFHTSMSTTEQASMMERQRVAAATAATAPRQASVSAASAGGSQGGTPQPQP